ncbi:hypothetical protein ACOMHN_007423 [Nucella lapillus]
MQQYNTTGRLPVTSPKKPPSHLATRQQIAVESPLQQPNTTRATTSDVREETKSRDYTEVANRRESPTTVRAGSIEELPRETRRPEEAVTSDITGETYGSGDQTAANGRGRFPPMAREDRVPVPHTTRKGKDSDDALRRECTSRAGRQTVRTRAGSRSTSAGRGLQQAGIDSYMRGQPANLNVPTNRCTPCVKSNVDK